MCLLHNSHLRFGVTICVVLCVVIAADILWGLGEKNMWLQIVDGWAHLKGKNAFGPEYVEDMKKAFKMCAKQLK